MIQKEFGIKSFLNVKHIEIWHANEQSNEQIEKE